MFEALTNNLHNQNTDGKYNFGERLDGTKKGLGFFGLLKRPNGGVSTELSTSFNVDGKEILMPLITPWLSNSELDHLLKGGTPTKSIYDKSFQHGMGRIGSGLSPFAIDGEQRKR